MSSVRFFDFLEQSLQVLRDEMPVAHEALVSTLEGRLMSIEADGERRVVSFGAEGLCPHAVDEKVDLAVGLERDTVLDLVDGRISLPRAVTTGRLALRGGVAAISRFDRAFQSYVRGAVRCPSMPGLLNHFRQS